MALKQVKDTEELAVDALRTAIQTWLAPELSGLTQRLTHVEAHLETIDKRMDGLERRIDDAEKRTQETLRLMRSEIEARFDTVRSDIRRLDNIAELRERMASLEAKLAQQN
jgi:chromosome segregation ATPase